jgi:AraC family transcriptional regulator, regulatory protein of adaptative response / methylated-DNA-[protein]-cysteine methyltransferase
MENQRTSGSFITIKEMTLLEYENQGEHLEIHYSFEECPFGKLLIASTPKGICSLSMIPENETLALEALQRKFPKAKYKSQTEHSHQIALQVFKNNLNSPEDITLHLKTARSSVKQYFPNPEQITLHLKGTAFQLKVWNALLSIPMGKLASYGDIAKIIESPKACRAVGSAMGENPVFYLIPCHRIILSSGNIGNYNWGSKIKTKIINWEARLIQQGI